MYLRKYQSSDCKELAELFYHTVHTVNAKDYTKEQLDVWAPEEMDLKRWDRLLLAHESLVALEHEILVGFGDIDQTGYLDHLFVHADYQGRGIAAAICSELERAVDAAKITAQVSVTAKPFFENRGYRVIKKQEVVRRGIPLTNYLMEKRKG